MSDTSSDERQVIDPDPFSVALGIAGAIAGTAAWLETRRQRRGAESRAHQEFRASWFACRRSVEFLAHSIEEFAIFADERDIRREPLHFGSVRIRFETRQDKDRFARLSRQIDITKANATENFEKISDFLGEEDSEAVNNIIHTVERALNPFPSSYAEVIVAGRRTVSTLEQFIVQLNSREHFVPQLEGPPR